MADEFGYIDLDKFVKADNIMGLAQKFHSLTFMSRIKNGYSTSSLDSTLLIENSKSTIQRISTFFLERSYKVIDTLFRGGYFRALRDFENRCVFSFVDVYISDNTMSLYLIGDKEEINLLQEWFTKSFNNTGTIFITASDVDRDGDIVTDKTYVSNKSVVLAHQSFYPWLSVDLNKYFKDFMASDEAVLVLFGSPGTGKSTFLRSLIMSGNYQNLLAYSQKVIESPALISMFYRGDSVILGCEDSDNYIGKRDDGNQLMSSILNASEGVVKHNKKIVYSTNLPSIDSIDPALLREGRCFDILEFKELTPQEAENASKAVNGDQKDWNSKKSWTLAEVLSKKSPSQQRVNRFGKKVGFF